MDTALQSLNIMPVPHGLVVERSLKTWHLFLGLVTLAPVPGVASLSG